MASAFRDFIPAGENVDGLGRGLTDFVPEKTKTEATGPVTNQPAPTSEATVAATTRKKKMR